MYTALAQFFFLNDDDQQRVFLSIAVLEYCCQTRTHDIIHILHDLVTNHILKNDIIDWPTTWKIFSYWTRSNDFLLPAATYIPNSIHCNVLSFLYSKSKIIFKYLYRLSLGPI